MRKAKKVIAFLLCLGLLATAIPLNDFIATTEPVSQDSEQAETVQTVSGNDIGSTDDSSSTVLPSDAENFVDNLDINNTPSPTETENPTISENNIDGTDDSLSTALPTDAENSVNNSDIENTPSPTETEDSTDEYGELVYLNPLTIANHAVFSSEIPIEEGYHWYDSKDGELKKSPNMYFFFYNPNNGSSKYEQEKNGYTSNLDEYSAYIYNNEAHFEDYLIYYPGTDQGKYNGFENVIQVDKVVLYSPFDRVNYDFVNWNTQPDGSGKSFEQGQEILNELTENYDSYTLYAQWQLCRTNAVIEIGTGTFPVDEFISKNNLTVKSHNENDYVFTYTDGSDINFSIENDKIYIESNCLIPLYIPAPSADSDMDFVGYTCTDADWDYSNNIIFMENKESRPVIKANYLSALQLQGTVDLNGYNGEGSVHLVWGTKHDDDVDKVYKIAQSLDGDSFTYIPDNNLTELLKGKEYGFTGSVQEFTAPFTGRYRIDAYGANAGVGRYSFGASWSMYHIDEDKMIRNGYGAHTSGYIELQKGQTIYLYVGEAGGVADAYNSTKRTYGGGGATCRREDVYNAEEYTPGLGPNDGGHGCGRGGGASYVSLTKKSMDEYLPANWAETYGKNVSEYTTSAVQEEIDAMNAAKQDIIMLAAGGSAKGDFADGADGGSLIGGSTFTDKYHVGTVRMIQTYGATQTAPGNGNPAGNGLINGVFEATRTTSRGTFFYGANGLSCTGAAGGGWFGGGISYPIGASGSSSYLGEQVGLKNGVAIAGGNTDNIDDAINPYEINGKIIIKCEEFWITTNTAENVYSPDKAGPDEPITSCELNTEEKGNITWNPVEDNSTSYWYRVDAFRAEDHNDKISETSVEKFDMLSGIKGYYYVIDSEPETIVHSKNGKFTTDTTVENVEILDIGEPVFFHVCAVDNAGNISTTNTTMVNRTSIVIDPNQHGSYEGSRDKVTYILKPRDVYALKPISADTDYDFAYFEKTTGDGIYANGEVTVGYSKTTLIAQYVAPLILKSSPNYTAYNKKGAVDLTWEESDIFAKKYSILQSTDKTNWYEAGIANNGSSVDSTNNYAAGSKAYETYVVPYSGQYTLTVAGSKGGNYGSYSGGNGSKISGTFNLKKGDILYIFLGKPGSNGGASGTYGAGGGATDIRLNGTGLENRILVAAGGGGANNGKNGLAEATSQSNVVNSGNNGVKGSGTSGKAGGGGGYYGGAAGNYSTSTQWLSDFIGKRPGTYDIGGYYSYNNRIGYNNVAYGISQGHPLTYGGYQWTPNMTADGIFPASWRIKSYGTIGGYTAVLSTTYGTANNLQSTGFLGICDNLGFADKTTSNFAFDASRTVVTSTQSQAGTSYINGNIGILSSLQRGVNNGNGTASIVCNIKTLGETNLEKIDGIVAMDTAAPNAPSTGAIISKNGTAGVITWEEPADNGTKYYHIAKSFKRDNNEALRVSNITEDLITTGVSHYLYYADNSSSGTVTNSNSSRVNTNVLSVSSGGLTKYYHIAAVDFAGNIGPTYTFQPEKATGMFVSVIWEDDNNAHGTRPDSGVSITLFNNNVQQAMKSLSAYDDKETIVFAESGNSAQISDFESKNSYYAYSTQYINNGLTIINKVRQIKKDIHVSITWDDNNDILQSRPENIDIILKDTNGNIIDTITIPNNQKDITFTEVPSDVDYIISVNDIEAQVPGEEYNTNVSDVKNDEATVVVKLNCTLTINPNGGTYNGTTEETNCLKQGGEKVFIPDPVRSGYTFTGWEVEGEAEVKDGQLEMPYNNVTLRATWEHASVSLIIDPNGGIYNGKDYATSYSMNTGDNKIISTPVREGYDFDDWELEGEGSNIVRMYFTRSLFVIGPEDAMLTAQWNAQDITVKLDPNGGTVDKDTITVTMDTPYGELPTPQRPGYDFTGWKKDDGETVTKDTIVSTPEDHTLTAGWKVKSIEIKGRIEWVDNNNEHGARPDSLIVNALSDGEFISYNEAVKAKGAAVIATNENWRFTIEPLQEYNVTTGNVIEYSVKLADEHFKTKNIHWQYSAEYSYDAVSDDFVITLTEYRATKAISGTVTWIDESNAFGSRPDKIVVDLYQDGNKVDSTEISETGDEWNYSFEDKLIFRDDYSEYEYTVNVDPNPTTSMNKDDCYETAIAGYEITETLSNGETTEKGGLKTVNGTITWVDDEDRFNYRPAEVQLTLYGNGEKVSSIAHNSAEKDFAFNDLPKYVIKDGHYTLIDYTITEQVNDWYEVEYEYVGIKNSAKIVDDYRIDVTNTFVPNENLVDTNARAELQMKATNRCTAFEVENPVFSVYLVEMQKEFTPSETAGKYELSYTSNETGRVFNLQIGKDYVNVNGIISGKYRIDIADGYGLELVEQLLHEHDGAELVSENGSYYVIFNLTKDTTYAQIEAIMDSEYIGYRHFDSINNYFRR